MDFKGVRKKSRVLWEVELMGIMRGKRIYFWRTSSKNLTRDVMKEAGLDVNRWGAEISQLTFRRIRKKT